MLIKLQRRNGEIQEVEYGESSLPDRISVPRFDLEEVSRGKFGESGS
jgi:hypothetical protein